MRGALAGLALCVALLGMGCGGESAESPAGAPSTSDATSRQRPSGDRPQGRARPISIEAGGRTFRRAEPPVEPPPGRPPSDLVVEDLVEGAGSRTKDGDELTVEYVGVYWNGAPFTNSWERSKPFKFELGAGGGFINPGWGKGLKGMRAGGRRKLIVPPKYLYRGGPPPETTAADTLVYVVDLIAIG